MVNLLVKGSLSSPIKLSTPPKLPAMKPRPSPEPVPFLDLDEYPPTDETPRHSVSYNYLQKQHPEIFRMNEKSEYISNR